MKTTLKDVYITKGTVITFDIAQGSPIDTANTIKILILDEHKDKVLEANATYNSEDNSLSYTFDGTEDLESIGNYYIFFKDSNENLFPTADKEVIIMSVLGFEKANDAIIEVLFVQGKVYLKNFNA
jgi:hypothetical protein